MLVTAVSGATFTVTRGIEGTAPAPHNAGAVVSSIITSGALTQMRTETNPAPVFLELATDASTSSASFATLLSQAVTVLGSSAALHIQFTASCNKTGATGASQFRIKVDGVVQGGAASDSATSLVGTTTVALVKKSRLPRDHAQSSWNGRSTLAQPRLQL